METIRFIRRILASSDPCAVLLRDLLVGFALVAIAFAIAYPISRIYFRNARAEVEKKRRIIGFFSPVLLAMAGFHGWLFWHSCEASAECGQMFEWNCQGGRPAFWAVVMVAGFSMAIALSVYEFLRWLRAHGV